MGVIDNEFKRLQDVVSGLEERVKQLEHRQGGGSPIAENIRMVIMGPPGAGTFGFLAGLNRQESRDTVPQIPSCHS